MFHLSVSLTLASSPGRRALGKEGSFSMKPICVCWKTSRNAKASHFGRGVCGADGEGKDAAKEPDTQRYAPCLSEPSYRYAAGVISPGLPSQALTRQLPQRGSPWQNHELCVDCQKLSLWERGQRIGDDGGGKVVSQFCYIVSLLIDSTGIPPVCRQTCDQRCRGGTQNRLFPSPGRWRGLPWHGNRSASPRQYG